jgi:membrane protein
MNWKKTREIAAKLASADSRAAEMAFYLALSLVPLVGVAVSLVGRLVPVDFGASIEAVLRDVLPAASHVGPDEVLRWARSSASQGWLKAGFFVALWTSFRFMSLCIRSLGTLVSNDGRPPATVWRSVGLSFLLLVVWIAALVATASFLLLGPAVERALLRFPKLADFPLFAFSDLRALLGAGILFIAIFLTYHVVADRRAGRVRVVLAALLASLGWIGASRGFALAVPLLWSATQLAGTLGSVVLFLLWAYTMAWVLQLGGFLLTAPDLSPTSFTDPQPVPPPSEPAPPRSVPPSP